MKIINLRNWIPSKVYQDKNTLACVYNGIDCLATAELYVELTKSYKLQKERDNKHLQNVYEMEIKASEVALAMTARGICVNTNKAKVFLSWYTLEGIQFLRLMIFI